MTGRVICVHSSLKSFGPVTEGARSVIEALLAERCTTLVPTFTYDKAVAPPEWWHLPRNGWSSWDNTLDCPADHGFSRDGNDLSFEQMGTIPAGVLLHPSRVRGDHPLNSFSAVGPHAMAVIQSQKPLDVYAPLRALAEHDGYIVLMGVPLTTMTFLHYAEQAAGRKMFRRWARLRGGRCVECEVGSCSDGFDQFSPYFASAERRITVGSSQWRAFLAREVLNIATQQIRDEPHITHCGRTDCERCNDAIAGGPLFT